MIWEPKAGEYFRSNYGHELCEILKVYYSEALKTKRISYSGVTPVNVNGKTEYKRCNVTVDENYTWFISHVASKPIRKNKNGVLDTRA